MLSSYFSYWRGSSAHLLEFLTPSSKELDDLHLSFLRAFGSIYISNFFETVLGFIEHQRNKYTVSFRLRGASIVGTFVGRTNELQQIGEEHEVDLLQTKESQRLKVVILQGLGGVGKSQLAIEYATRHESIYTAVFWCNGKSEALLRLDIAAIAEQIPLKDVLSTSGKILKDETGVENAIAAVLDWLSENGNTQWLVIVDNVDSQRAAGVGSDSPETSYDIWRQFPHQGSLLLKSRLACLRRLGKGVEIQEVTVQDGLRILCNPTGGSVADRGY